MDTAGLRVLVGAHVRLGQLPEAIVLRGPSRQVRSLLHITCVSQLFDIIPTTT